MLAAIPTSIAWVLLIFLVLGWVFYFAFNLRWARKESGAEVELAPNRKQYYDDEGLEGPRLEAVQVFGLAMLIIITIGLPLYWVFEPGRQAGATRGYEKRYASWGSQTFAPTAEGGFNCAGCHGGMNAGGGSAAYTVTNPNTGEVQAVTWKAPALNTVMHRYSDDEVRYILVYGRPFSPMSPWGVEGGGPMNFQQINNLVAYLHSIQIPQEGCTKDKPLCKGTGADLQIDKQKAVQTAAEKMVADGTAKSLGEALFSLDLDSGAFACARCHTKGWSFDNPQTPGGGGALGPNLTGGVESRQFPNVADNEAFICNGSENGKKYGSQGQGSGRMPGFCGQYTDEQLKAVVEYIRGL